jgi:hypothetical protein
MFLVFNDYRAGAMGSLVVRGPEKNFIRDVWGFGMKHADKFRFQKSFNKFREGKKYNFCYEFDLVAKLITLTIVDDASGDQIFKMTSPPSQSPNIGSSIRVTSGDIFVISMGDTGAESHNHSKSIGWEYKLNQFLLEPVGP